MEQHLTFDELEQLAENELDTTRHAEIAEYLTTCAVCRARVKHHQQMNHALRTLPQAQLPTDLIARIEMRANWEQVRRARLPFIALAMLLSFAVAGWFCIELGIALEENGILDFWTLLTTYSDQFSIDLLRALVEAIPLTETMLTLCALMTVGVFAQQLIETLRPRPIGR
jgi:predicted anti-sigma-YlaC factor YlaD